MSLMGFQMETTYFVYTGSVAADAPLIFIKMKVVNGQLKLVLRDGVRAFEFYYNLAIRDGSVPQGSTEVDYKTMVNLLATDQVAMAISGPPYDWEYCSPTKSGYGWKVYRSTAEG